MTLEPRNAEAVALDFEVEVLPFTLVRPQRTHVFRLSPGNGLIMGPDKEMHRRAAIRDLVSHGFLPEVSIWWPTHLLDETGATRRDAQGRISIDWDRGNLVGTPDAQISAILALGSDRRVWLDDGAILRFGLLDAFGAGGTSDWSIQDTEDWLQAIEKRLGPDGYGFEAIYLHITGEESHYTGAKRQAWLALLAFVSENRTAQQWPHVFTTHSFNTEPGQREALAQGGVDLPALGMFHGIGTDAALQVQQAQQTGKPFLFYGLRGRLVPGFYLWKAGGSGSFHEWYSRFEGAPNNDWDNPIAFDHAGHSGSLLHEGPGWDNAHYSPTGKMVGSWMWEEIREGVDDDAYMVTLEHWIEATRDDPRATVVAARHQAQETLEDIRSQIDLRDVGGHSAEEQSASPGIYARVGLSLVRPWHDGALAFDRMRRQASAAITKLVRAKASETVGPETIAESEQPVIQPQNASKTTPPGDDPAANPAIDPLTTPEPTPSLTMESNLLAAEAPGPETQVSTSSEASDIYSLKGNEKITISGGCPKGKDPITAEVQLGSEGTWRVSTSAGYAYGGNTQKVGTKGRKMYLHLDQDGFGQYEAAIVDWSNELCQTSVTEISHYRSNKFTVKLNKTRAGIKVKLKTNAIQTTPLGAKKAKHSLVGKGRAI